MELVHIFSHLGHGTNTHFSYLMRFDAMMTFEQADVLAGRAKSTSAQFYVAYELDKMAEKYKEAWQRFGINTGEMAIV
jgi:hypothetical protein